MQPVALVTVDQIRKMSYTSFLGFINQWNIPPGSISTVSEWAVFGRVGQRSKVLEMACTTGFTGRELALLTGCTVRGIDLCRDSIDMALYNHRHYAPSCKLSYECCNAYDFSPKSKFSHVILGACLAFFPDPNRLMQKCISVLKDGGIMLTSPYYLASKKLPARLIARCKTTIGIYPTNVPYKEAMRPYRDLEIVYESRKDIVGETREEMEKYCTDTISRACVLRRIERGEVRDAVYRRLYQIKDVSNELHKRHAYSVLVLRNRKKVYPARYVELF